MDWILPTLPLTVYVTSDKFFNFCEQSLINKDNNSYLLGRFNKMRLGT